MKSNFEIMIDEILNPFNIFQVLLKIFDFY